MEVGVIGAGSMGENHIRVYSNLIDHCKLVGIYEVNEERAIEVSKRYGVKHFKSLDQLLQSVEAVSIAVPTEYHYEIGLKCIEHKVHMLIEKPIAKTVAEAEDLEEKAKIAGVKIQVGHVELYNPTVEILKKILVNEKIIAIDVHRLSPFNRRIESVDVVHDLMIHDLYILYHLLSDEIDTFDAIGRFYDNTIKHAIAIATFQKGTIAQLTASFKTEGKIRTIRVITEDAFIQADLLNKTILISRSTSFFVNSFSSNYNQQSIVEKVMIPQKEPLSVELEEFLNNIQNNKDPAITAKDGIKALSMTTAISEKIISKRK
ncbi:Gfo/Idh/MocA family protein [Pontibacillus marinus]|uniref:Oxidoreductase n=1 Tax=Pontibacillus marinus BH030004 = DSM 16465 TaxID=1385511 RepID=A0A0A5GB52_9BACI|nr:Gfo/Idh/MocA family oxidoreductase [Pontibacillus marinus]KGX89269.1 oxidoreductase [Pontibacillus marinus BH030004 = DSM 16465]